MYYARALEVLGIDDDDGLTRTKLRRIYLRKLKDHPPEKDPDGFRELREAFELAREYVEDDPVPSTEADHSAPVVVDAHVHAATPKADVFGANTFANTSASTNTFASSNASDTAYARGSDSSSASSAGSGGSSGSTASTASTSTPVAPDAFVPFAMFDLSQPHDPVDNAKFFGTSKPADKPADSAGNPNATFFGSGANGSGANGSNANDSGANGSDNANDTTDANAKFFGGTKPSNANTPPNTSNANTAPPNTSNANTTPPNTSNANTTPPNTSNANTTPPNTSNANTAPPNTAPPNTAPPNTSNANTPPPNTSNANTAPPHTAPPNILNSAPPKPPVDHALPPLSSLRQPEPPLPLSVLVPKLLELLEAGHVETARELESDWRAAGDTDDYRQANIMIAARWSLLRELLLVAGEIPLPVSKALAKAIGQGDLAKARPELLNFRRANPFPAEAANSLIAKKAPTIHKQIEGTLYIPPKVAPPTVGATYSSYSAPPSRRSGSALGGVGIFAVIGMAIVRVMGTTSSHHYAYEDIKPIKIPDIDYSRLSQLDYHPPKFDPNDLFVPPPRPIELPDRSPETVWAMLFESATTLQRDISSKEQQGAASTFSLDVLDQNCGKARKSLKKLDLAPFISIENRRVYAEEHLAAIHRWMDIVCPAKKQVVKKPKPKAPAPDPEQPKTEP